MRKFLIQSCSLMIAAAGMLLSSCKTDPDVKVVVLDPEPTVSIEFVGTPGVSSVSVKFVPDQSASKYEFAFGSDQDRVNFENGDIVGLEQVVNNSEKEMTWDELNPETYYVVYARAYNEAGEAGPVSALGFKTATSDFMVSPYYVGEDSAGFIVENTNDYYTYRYAVGSAADREAFLNGLLKGMTTMNETFMWGANYFDLVPGTDYVFYCIGEDRSGRPTQLFEIPFKTATKGSNEIPNFTLTEGDHDFYQQEYIVTPNALCKQLVLYAQTVGDMDGVMFGVNNYRGLVMDMIDVYKDISGEKNVSTFTATNEELVATPKNKDMELDTELDLYIVAYDDMYNPHHVQKFASSTPSFNSNAPLPDATHIKLEVTDVQPGSVNLKVHYENADDLRAMIYTFVEVEWFERELESDYEALRKYFIDNRNNVDQNGKPIIDGFQYGTYDFSVPFSTAGLVGEHFVAAVAMNVNGPTDGWSENMAVSNIVTFQ